ncbi:hypothetical protein E2C01_100727 [Portunus trituberculatus]|uniref:Uncharacterized protein n=1 Tax=Portunus trituberculatus TaxID=210409 RepID=A0A5B7KIM9_PORTR|nr:hypothetical protein [Portunus trituberculatus]
MPLCSSQCPASPRDTRPTNIRLNTLHRHQVYPGIVRYKYSHLNDKDARKAGHMGKLAGLELDVGGWRGKSGSHCTRNRETGP